MKVREVLRILHENGWRVDRQRGSHRRLSHPTNPYHVTVAGNESKEVPPDTLKSIFRQAGLDRSNG